MTDRIKILIFGAISGLIWSTVPGTLSELFRSPGETGTVLFSGILAAIVTSFALAPLLARFGRRGAIYVGLLSLPVGAFAFGVLIAFVQFAVRGITETPYRFAHNFAPLTAGAEYALLSMVSIFAIILFPLAILTTFVLRSVVRKGNATPAIVKC